TTGLSRRYNSLNLSGPTNYESDPRSADSKFSTIMSELLYPEVTLLRDNSDADTPKGRRRPSGGRTAKPSAPEPEPPAPEIDPNERIRHVLAILMVLFSLLLFLALVSYTPHDQANADIRV